MIKQLDGGLILRSISEGCASDREGLPQFYMDTFGEAGNDDAPALGAWTHDLLSGHPTVTADDLWVVVDPSKNDKIVSALLLIPQTWHYDDMPVQVGRVELVATDKEYRRRGLVRHQMDAAHQRSEELGHVMQGITGIGHYYRRFGYTMAVNLGIGGVVSMASVDVISGAEPKTRYTFRPAADSDIPNLAVWDAYRARTSALSLIRTPELWRYELHGRNQDAPFALKFLIIVNEQGEDVGYLGIRHSEHAVSCYHYVVGEKSSYLDTYEDVMRELRAAPEKYFSDKPDFKPGLIHFDSGQDETVQTLIEKTWGARVYSNTEVYAWYIRVNDVGRFIQQIAPVLERRLQHSGANRYTGSLTIGFYDLTGVEIKFEDGRITEATQRPFDIYEGDGIFPYHAFLNILFGHRSADELKLAMPEVRVGRKAAVLLNALFPQRRSWLLPLA